MVSKITRITIYIYSLYALYWLFIRRIMIDLKYTLKDLIVVVNVKRERERERNNIFNLKTYRGYLFQYIYKNGLISMYDTK